MTPTGENCWREGEKREVREKIQMENKRSGVICCFFYHFAQEVRKHFKKKDHLMLM